MVILKYFYTDLELNVLTEINSNNDIYHLDSTFCLSIISLDDKPWLRSTTTISYFTQKRQYILKSTETIG